MICESPLDWKMRVCLMPCLMRWEKDHVCEFPLQAHHVITQQQLKRRKLHHLLWDTGNGVPVCVRAHRRHTLAVERIPRDLLPAAAISFAETHDLTYVLERNYPQRGIDE